MSTTATSGRGGRGTRAPHLRYVIYIAATAALGGFLFGYDSSVINGAVEGIRGRFDVSSGTLGTVVAIALLGAALGAVAAGRLADRLGRIRVMRIAAALFMVSAIGSMLPFTVWDLAFWRTVGGVAIGMASVIAPAYIAEVSPSEYRGRLASFQQAAIVLGIALSQLVNWGLVTLADGDQRGDLLGLEAWQVMLGVEALPALVYGLMTFGIPESPRHLVARGRTDEARRVLADVEGPGTDLDARIAEIHDRIAGERRSSWRDLVGGRAGLLPIVYVGIGLSVFQQLVGINVIFYYSNSLWQSVGIDPDDSFFYSFTTSIINIVGTVIAMLLVDRIGRRALLLIGSVGMTLMLGLTAWAFSYTRGTGEDIRLPDAQGTAALVGAHGFVLFFALSWGVVVWVLLGEMFPNRLRAAALGVAASAQWIANWAISQSFPTLSEWNLSGAYVMYTVFALLSIPFLLAFVPETKGKSLEEMG
ncbi:sugar porter family MFS transporter [Streptomyces marincola]|uniref:sugar porter family MFS transporter n=1 Tax=Streptomyces marincola TaxID=2878388 RepID=UPI001CF3BE96|nr:sugar porter family MFS transporter [Streptomyces marincola]UCM90715.1 sugar porter family MFS transporter [Streptomyces marincola]